MKQVVFAVLLMAMASLTGCLNTEDSPVDENIDTTDDSTSDTTEDNTDTTEDNTDTTQDDTKDDELIEPVGTNGGYTPPETANITVDYTDNLWVAKDGHRIFTSCINASENNGANLVIYDSDDRVIFIASSQFIEGAYYDGDCGGIRIDITLGPEPAKVEFDDRGDGDYSWIATF